MKSHSPRHSLFVWLIAVALLCGTKVAPAQQSQPAPLWQPPLSAPPVELPYLPDGVQAVMAWRAAEFVAQPEAPKVFAALGPLGTWLQETLPERTGVPLADCERIVLGFLDPSLNPASVCAVLFVHRPIDLDRLLAARGAKQTSLGRNTVFVVDDTAYCMLAHGDGNVLVMCPREELAAVLSRRSATPALSRELEELRRESNQSLQLVVLCAPGFWINDGDLFTQENRTVLREWIEWYFAGSARGVLASAHLAENFYLEARVALSADNPAAPVARAYRERLTEAANRVAARLAEHPPAGGDRELLDRLPRMLSVVDQHTRSAVEGRQIVLRSYLPQHAAHNLVLAGRVFLEHESR